MVPGRHECAVHDRHLVDTPNNGPIWRIVRLVRQYVATVPYRYGTDANWMSEGQPELSYRDRFSRRADDRAAPATAPARGCTPTISNPTGPARLLPTARGPDVDVGRGLRPIRFASTSDTVARGAAVGRVAARAVRARRAGPADRPAIGVDVVARRAIPRQGKTFAARLAAAGLILNRTRGCTSRISRRGRTGTLRVR